MAKTVPQLILFSTDSTFLETLKPFSAMLPYVCYEVGNGPQVTAKAHLDALWATLMTGVELFGASPPFPLHEARIHKTPQIQRQRGLPMYGVVGVAVSEDDPKTPEYNLRLVISALSKAVNDFNAQNKDQIRRIGILPEDLLLKRLKPDRVFRIIQETYEEKAAGPA